MLMGLMVDAIIAETDELMRQRVRVRAIGNLADLPAEVREKLDGLMARTAANDGLTLVLALSYGAKWEILAAAKRLADGTMVSPPLEDLSPFLPEEEMDANMIIPRIRE